MPTIDHWPEPFETVVAAAPSDAQPKPITNTRRYVNGSLVEDYKNLHEDLKKAVMRVRDLVKAKEDLEVLALVSGIALPNLGDTV